MTINDEKIHQYYTGLHNDEGENDDPEWIVPVKIITDKSFVEIVFEGTKNEIALRLEVFNGRLQLLLWGEQSATGLEDPELKHVFAQGKEDWQRIVNICNEDK